MGWSNVRETHAHVLAKWITCRHAATNSASETRVPQVDQSYSTRRTSTSCTVHTLQLDSQAMLNVLRLARGVGDVSPYHMLIDTPLPEMRFGHFENTSGVLSHRHWVRFVGETQAGLPLKSHGSHLCCQSHFMWARLVSPRPLHSNCCQHSRD